VEQLIDGYFRLSGEKLSPDQANAFQIYEDELCVWNEKFNLTAIRDREEIHIKHFLDSLTCLEKLGDLRGLKMIDIGTGAGFPGLPIKIVSPEVAITLVDSVGKKLEFCRHLIQTLDLRKATCIQSRAEDMGQSTDHREDYDRAVARAVAGLPVLVEYLIPLLKVGGIAVIQKGCNAPAEVNDAKKALRLMGGDIEDLQEVNLPGVEEPRYLITICKIATTPAAYPRRAGIPSKKPII
jgi:16S rRNA (guanine527-N7)-methyltransferase